MEIEKLISVLEETIRLLNDSQSSSWASTSIEEIITGLESEISKAGNAQPIDAEFLGLLFAPTGAIQETSIDNGWGKDFLRISEVIDDCLSEE